MKALRVSRIGATCCTQEIARNHRGLSVAFSNGFQVAVSNGCSLFSGMFQTIVTCPMFVTGTVQWMFSGIFRWIVVFERSGVYSFALPWDLRGTKGSPGRGFEHRSTRGFEHARNREQHTVKPVVTYDPLSLGPP